MAQIDLVQLFNDFKINSLHDYKTLPHRDKSIFASRLYKKLTNRKYEEYIFGSIKSNEGVRFHYDCQPGKYDKTQIATFLKKLSFYSDKSLITIPLKGRSITKQDFALNGKRFHIDEDKMLFGEIEIADQSEYGGEIVELKDNALIIEKASFDHLVETIAENKKLLEKDDTLYFFTGLAAQIKKRMTNSLDLTSANFNLDSLKAQFYEFGDRSAEYYQTVMPPILLPQFTNVPVEHLIEIEKQEAQLYFKFHSRIRDILKSKIDKEKELLHFMQEIDNEIKLLRTRFEIIKSAYLKKNVFLILSQAQLLNLVFHLIPAAVGLTVPILGGIKLKEYFDKWVDNDKETSLLKLDPFYIMYKLNEAGK
jgi:hypothetical protein